jgi:hypothetical protein
MKQIQQYNKEHFQAFLNSFQKYENYLKRLKIIRFNTKSLKNLPQIQSVGISYGFNPPEGLNKQIREEELNQINNSIGKIFGNKSPKSNSEFLGDINNNMNLYTILFKSSKEIKDILTEIYFNLSDKDFSKPFESNFITNSKEKTTTIVWEIPGSNFISIKSILSNLYENFGPEIVDNKCKIFLSVTFKNYKKDAEKFEILLNSKPFRIIKT